MYPQALLTLAPPNSVFGIFFIYRAYPNCRWLNLLELSKRLINPKTDELAMLH
jgi:hypothetical protein